MKLKFWTIFFVFTLASKSGSAEIILKDPMKVGGKSLCDKGYHLIQDACVKENALLHNRPEEIAAALQARKDPTLAKKYNEEMAHRKANGIPLYKTRISEEKGDILKLDNGGVVEITFGFVGFVGFNKKALLFKEGMNWKIWIEGKKTFPVEILKAPTIPPSYILTISDILDYLE
jgi:hypothetical protein